MTLIDTLFNQSIDLYLFILAMVCLIIGIICASIVRSNDTDQVKGNKRICAVFFIMLFLLLVVAILTKRNCAVKAPFQAFDLVEPVAQRTRVGVSV
jgi:cell division protein FtsW (lipid II flippase)